MWVTEVLRGVRFLAYYFAGAGFGNYRFLRAHARGGLDAAHAVIRERADRALRMAGAELTVLGEERIPEGRCVFIYNEASLLDLVLLHRCLQGRCDTGVGAEVFRFVPLMIPVVEKMNWVIFERGNREAATRMLERVTAIVAAGGRLSMGGEGRMARDGGVGRFKRGACLVAIRAGAPVVPVALAGGPEMMPVGSLRLRPGKLTVCFGQPISVDGWTEERAPEMASVVRDAVVEMRDRHRPG